MVKVVYFQRKQRAHGNYSVEIYFNQVRKNLHSSISPIQVDLPFESSGVFRRLANCVFAFFKQGDINHVTGDITYIGMFLSKKKTVLTILDLVSIHAHRGLKRLLFKKLWFEWPISRARSVIAISSYTKKDIEKTLDCKNSSIEVIFFSSNCKFSKCEKPFFKDNPSILQIGTAPNKNISTLCEALKGIACKLVIIGKVFPDIREKLLRNSIDHEIWEERLTDEQVEQRYRESDIVSLPSTLEGFGMPIIEGNSVGRVVVTSNVTSMPEVAGDSAILVDPYCVKSMRAGFLLAIDDDQGRQRLIENGFKNIMRFDTQVIAEEHYQLYKKLFPNLFTGRK